MHLENVSGRSAYIVDLVSSIKQVAEVVRGRVEGKKYIRNFADKAVGCVDSPSCDTPVAETLSLIITRFTQSVIKSRPLKKIGAEQVRRHVRSGLGHRSSCVDSVGCTSGQGMFVGPSRTSSRKHVECVGTFFGCVTLPLIPAATQNTSPKTPVSSRRCSRSFLLQTTRQKVLFRITACLLAIALSATFRKSVLLLDP